MNKSEQEQYIIEQYEKDEKMMVLIFAQWCVNHNLSAKELYEKAYPAQMKNPALEDALEQTVPKEQADEISNDMVLYALQLFGNDDLAFVVQEMIESEKTD